MSRNPASSQKKSVAVSFTEQSKKVEVPSGSTILDAAVKAGIKLYTACGGRGTCGKCLVRLKPDGPGVLACQYHLTNDVDVHIPPASLHVPHRILHQGIEYDITICPAVRKLFIRPSGCTPSEVIDTLHLTGADCSYSISKSAGSLAQLLPADCEKGITVVCRNHSAECSHEAWEVVALEKGDTTRSLLGVAIDIGTTTVVAALMDLATGSMRAATSALNPQNAFGDDVISRITHGQNDAGLAELHDVTIAKVNELIAQLSESAGVASGDIYELSVVGNTTMNHIFLGLPIKQLGHAPYKAWSVEAHDVAPADLGININPAGNIHAVQNIAGFVGADTVAAALAVRMDLTEKMTLVIDIGTNGELIVGTKDRMFAASCAAGPAFEGAKIAHGSRAMEGAIERVAYDSESQDLEVRTIGGLPPVSICGSGLIDVVGVLLELGVLDDSGRFIDPKDASGLPEKIRQRLLDNNGQGAFVLAKDIILTQRDVRELQLAKAAIRAGIKLLQAKAGVDDSQIEEYLVAGAFGNYIDPGHAMRIGLLPKVPLKKVRFVGNAAESGAKIILLNRDLRKLAGDIARRIHYVEIAHEREFESTFTECLMF